VVTILLSIATSIISSALTIFLAPRVQHGFWSRERITDLRLATYDKVNGITAAISITEPGAGLGLKIVGLGEPAQLSPFQSLLASLMAAGDEVKNRFSDSALRAFKALEVLVTAEGLPTEKRTQYSEARDEVLRQLHLESLG
jgi:hypothetical protein